MAFQSIKTKFVSLALVGGIAGGVMQTRDWYFAPIRSTEPGPLQGYPDTYYIDAVHPSERQFSPEKRDGVYANQRTFDVVVVGGGFAGLHTALRLQELGKRVCIVEQQRVGGQASGMNGGMAIPGFHSSNEELAAYVGDPKIARNLYEQTLDGLQRIRDVVKTYNIQCDLKECGILNAMRRPQKPTRPEELKARQEEANRVYGESYTLIDRNETQGLAGSPLYKGGMFMANCCSVNPLGLVLGLASAFEARGGIIAENAKACKLEYNPGNFDRCKVSFRCCDGQFDGYVIARDVVCATNSVPRWFSLWESLFTMAFYSSILVTEPLPKDLLDSILPTGVNVCDDRFALAYYRRLDGDRILWGGRLPSACPMPYSFVQKSLLGDLEATFPQLKGKVKATKVWQGRMLTGYPPVPLVGRVKGRDGLWVNTGHFCHGVVPTAAAGIAVAEAIALQKTEKVEVWEKARPWVPLIPIVRQLAAQGAATMCIAQDWMEGVYS